MKKLPSPAPPVETGFERHQYVFFIDRASYDDFTSKGGLLSQLLAEQYGLAAFMLELVQDDEAGLAFHLYHDFPIADSHQ